MNMLLMVNGVQEQIVLILFINKDNQRHCNVDVVNNFVLIVVILSTQTEHVKKV